MSAPDELAAALAEARSAQAEGRIADAERSLTKLLTRLDEPPQPVEAGDLARLRARVGQLRIRLGALAGAVVVLRDALTAAEDGYARLHLGHALLLTGALAEADGHLEQARDHARADGDGPLAIGSWCATGELRLIEGRAGEAVEAFGRALGITELAPGEAASVLPLAGLADAHRGWRNPGKAPALAERAVERADRIGDPALQARALLALGVALGDPERLDRGAALAERAPHVPLLVRLLRTRVGLRDDPELRERARVRAAEAGLTPELERLHRP